MTDNVISESKEFRYNIDIEFEYSINFVVKFPEKIIILHKRQSNIPFPTVKPF